MHKARLRLNVFSILILFVCFAHGQTHKDSSVVVLKSDQQVIQIEAATLAIEWQTTTDKLAINQASLLVNGVAQYVNKVEQQSESSASWVLKPSQIQISVSFNQTLQVSFEYSTQAPPILRNQPIQLTWFDLPEQFTQTLLMPFNEGMRIPTDNKTWTEYAISTYSGATTTQDLKMPFWTAELVAQRPTFVSVHLLTATDNRLQFSEQGNKLDLTAEHDFTILNSHQPFAVQFILGQDQLDGAKYYRAWRKQKKLSTSLAERLVKQPQIKRLIGASQVYLFGGKVLSHHDVKDWWGLKKWYFSQTQFKPTKELIKEIAHFEKGKDWLSIYQKRLLIENINLAVERLIPPDKAINKEVKNQNGIEQQFIAAQNRKTWLVKHAGQFLIESNQWGQGIAKGMLDTFKSAKLEKLWLGFDNWMPAFYQPEVIDQAKATGYLIGTYDSYNTGIPKGLNDSWLTAQLPDDMRNTCAIQRADGVNVKGFQNSGFYLNPACGRPYVEQRIKDLLRFGRFNSLFLDVDATAMAREDYSFISDGKEGMDQKQMLEAFNQRMDWIAQQGVVLGSEDGNALTTQGLAFAHGMVTHGFGWRDPDMRRNRKSPYFWGAWYPDARPAVFFKSAQVKEPYKTLLFSPQFRVPLYQTVFHDEVINTHHWLFDSLKFIDVKIARDLTSMLYNTPAMVQLSRDDAIKVSQPRIKALKHYQQGFLPIHTQLWDKALTDFKWLDDKGQLQQTSFSDGSKIIANFSLHQDQKIDEQLIPKTSIVAFLSNGQVISWTASP
ncbi:glycoside hydrolase [Paraglaciecola aquimarina]|uniref:Glycoside hydrolase n=1 Tax=Paraglaciecola algarum TaxID=3050085 RepID=A0ABS9D9V4_9ALTE|nr:glycoside hydrolase [Paraglaciecola sp. G1-23]MCF2949693.1 glycoside hydrolase [Paraglaciecola sp. G1-23]